MDTDAKGKMMQMIDVKINGLPLTNLNPIAEVRGIEIKTLGIRTLMERSNARALVKFVYACTQKCIGVISYNGVIIDKDDIKEIKF